LDKRGARRWADVDSCAARRIYPRLRSLPAAPRSAREFNGRLAVYFKSDEGYGKSVTLAWGLRKLLGDPKVEAERIRSEIVQIASAPHNAGVWVDQEGPQLTNRPLSGLTYAFSALVATLLGIGLLIFYVGMVPKLVLTGTQHQFFYLLLIPWALCSAAFLFGAMRSYARFTYKHLGNFLELGGPVVLFCLVLVGGFKLVPPPQDAFDLTVRAHSADASVPVIDSGNVTIELDNNRATRSLATNGEADFKGIPAKFMGTTIRILPEVNGYEHKWLLLKIEGNSLDSVPGTGSASSRSVPRLRARRAGQSAD